MKFVFRPSKKGVSQVLGELESKVMKEVWRNPNCSAREVLDRLRMERTIAQTTVSTILSRLCKKGLLTRRREEKVYLYSSVVDQQQFNEMVTRDVLEGLLKGNSRPILSTFVDLVSTDEELLEELDDLVRRKRG